MPGCSRPPFTRSVRGANHRDTPPIVAINISALTLGDRNFPARVAEALMRHRLPASVLEIEIPEDIATRDLDRLSEVLQALRAIGIKLALDDFGGGLSSVAHLVRLPVRHRQARSVDRLRAAGRGARAGRAPRRGGDRALDEHSPLVGRRGGERGADLHPTTGRLRDHAGLISMAGPCQPTEFMEFGRVLLLEA